ncbi:Rv3235 family protein [Kribbella catacumbae]|uniref:Rv3235 family protein n=1 Tax=Kribbella catacumbae TaxID=460086 RepID=UPI0003601A3A|nr:Rv3235 family protein [Kribbella catacumbae]
MSNHPKLTAVRSLPTDRATPTRRHAAAPMTQGALAMHYQETPDLHPASAPPVLRLVPTGPTLPDAQAWATRLVQAVAEVLAGDRPIGQLIRFTDTFVFTDLNRRVRVLGLTTTATGRSARERSAIRSVHVSTPATEVAEVSAHVRCGDRSRAMALRLEVHRNRWICTALQLG